MTIVAGVVLAILLPFVLFDVVFRPTIRRLALRNIVRRPGEAALVVGGSLLATALITASFIIGDSFGSSIRGVAVDRWGPTDELVLVTDPADMGAVKSEIGQIGSDLVDGTLAITYVDVSAGSVGPDAVIEPELLLLEADPDGAKAFTEDQDLFGSGRQTPLAADEIVINQGVADDLGLSVGERLNVFIDAKPVPYTVAAIRPETGLTGFGDLIVGTGSITGALQDPGAVATSAVLVSNTGGIFSGAELSDQAVTAIEDRVGDRARVVPVKQDLLDDAEAESAEMTELFGTIGGFSVAAGILLVVNLFVMLAGERKSEMGTLRAMGLRRGHLVRSYSMEGAAYGILAAIAGVGVGIAVAAAVMRMAGGLFDGDLTIRLDVVPASLLSGAIIGLMVSQLTVLLTSWRTTRLNIVRALRELPEPASASGGRRRLVIGGIGVTAGIGLYAVAGTTPLVAMLAPVIALLSLVPLVDRFVPRRAAIVAVCTLALTWVATVFGLLPEVMADPEIFMFLLQGVLLVGLATVIVAMLDKVWLRLAEAISRGGIAARLGLAEPLARPARSALLVAMYALVIFTVTFMVVLNAVFQAQAPEFAVQAGGAYDIYLDANATSGITADQLAERDDIDSAAAVRRGILSGRSDASSPDEDRWRVSGVDPSFLAAQPPQLHGRSDDFASDADAWAAVAGSGPYLIVDTDVGFDPGDTYQFEGADGTFTTFTVAGTTEQGWLVNAGPIIGDDLLVGLFDDNRPPTRFYLDVIDEGAAKAVAASLTDDGVQQGVDAQTFLAAAKSATDEQQGFLNLLQAYLGLGLLIGIAGLGVVLVRAVRERRRQFGVMRALGIASPVIRQAFIIEAAFVAVQGVILGISLGLLSSWQVLTRSSAFEEGLSFTVPGLPLLLLGIGCLIASLIVAAVPAVRAGRTVPAVALRMTT